MYHILICDDEQDIVNALKIYLMNPDFKLFEANTGVQALEVMEREDIHLILLDIMMPEMDGISAMVKIREKSNVPIILLTAKSEDTDKILGLNTGADDYITKPFNPDGPCPFSTAPLYAVGQQSCGSGTICHRRRGTG